MTALFGNFNAQSALAYRYDICPISLHYQTHKDVPSDSSISSPDSVENALRDRENDIGEL